MNAYDTTTNAVTKRFRAGLESEYGTDGRRWLADLPQLLQSLSARWEFEFTDLTPLHGYLSLVWPVRRRSQTLALKVTMPSSVFAQETAALLAWDGQAMVRLDRCDVELGAALLQWLDAGMSLMDVPIREAVGTAGRMLAISPTVDPTTASRYEDALLEAEAGARRWSTRNSELGDALSPAALRGARAALERIGQRPGAGPSQLVNHDLHYENVIRDWDGNWVCIDPKPVIGPPEYAIAPLIWRRYRDPKDAVERASQLSAVASLDASQALDWLLVRTVEYLFWALGAGLTTDPDICRELISHLTSW